VAQSRFETALTEISDIHLFLSISNGENRINNEIVPLGQKIVSTKPAINEESPERTKQIKKKDENI
jgi:hypothetical protein